MFAHLLFAADGSEGREGSNTRLCFVAKRTGDRVSVMTAAMPWSAVTNGDPSAFALRFQIICETVLVADVPAEAIVKTAKAKACNPIVLASAAAA